MAILIQAGKYDVYVSKYSKIDTEDTDDLKDNSIVSKGLAKIMSKSLVLPEDSRAKAVIRSVLELECKAVQKLYETGLDTCDLSLDALADAMLEMIENPEEKQDETS